MIPQIGLATLALSQVASSASVSPHPVRLETRTKLNSRAANIRVFFDKLVEGVIDVSYGSCMDRRQADSHHAVVGRHLPSTAAQRLVWVIPDDAFSGGCLSAWSEDGSLLGRSEPQHLASQRSRKRGVEEIQKRSALKKRDSGDDSIPMNNATGIDAWGPWFDGVELLQSKNLSAVDVSAAKSKKIGIVGGGMSGLMTFLALRQAGFENLEIIEGGERLGGRVHTVYLSGGPFDYSYQGQLVQTLIGNGMVIEGSRLTSMVLEMGPMRFPYQWTSSTNETFNITDHQLVFQLAAEMNEINNHAANWSVDFIPWYQSNDNGLYYYNGIRTADGMPPTIAQVAANSSMSVQTVDDASTISLTDKVDAVTANDEFYAKMATNMFEAHREFIGESQPMAPEIFFDCTHTFLPSHSFMEPSWIFPSGCHPHCQEVQEIPRVANGGPSF